ncbi:hypothetical protein LROSL1_2136 [Furfurilactobacillus rossiae]|uniref:DUF3278 domain-containing protein n=1 Tax=Furfurilactobacillus rossiae TaxID=231049 RepID=UPI0015B86614|nr:DUF3278 domain-containing protein [Furfurilactobacillus rossiae]MCF6164649.1 DUF3278 domain-containing protein [Furfurilactobacillus rossiae]QLE64937.1 hypothetical protein LROSL1_2136 [Furfurilactobacillus rossiae]
MIKRMFVGYLTPRDERQMTDINKRLAGLYILSFYLTAVIMAVSLVMDIYFDNGLVSRGTILITVLMMLNSLIYIIRFWHAESVTSEVINDLNKKQVIHHLQLRTLGQAVYFFVFMTAWMIFLNSLSFTAPADPIGKVILMVLIESILFGLLMYVVGRVKIHE